MLRLKHVLRSVNSTLIIGSLCLAGFFALATPSSGQATQAAIIGSVTDSSGAILPGVTVIAKGPALQVPWSCGATDLSRRGPASTGGSSPRRC